MAGSESELRRGVQLSVLGKFNAFHLARELETLGYLDRIHVAYPRAVGVDRSRIRRVPLLYEVLYLLQRTRLADPQREFAEVFDRLVSRRIARLPSRVFHGWAGYSARSLRSARAAGAVTVIDRAGSHVLWQRRLLEEEAEGIGTEFGRGYFGMTERMLQEYEDADWIVVPSTYAKNTFVEQGVDPGKIHIMVAGVTPPQHVVDPGERGDEFIVLYVGGIGAQKGLYYMLEGWRRAGLRRGRLIVVSGHVPDAFGDLVRQRGVELMPTVPQMELFGLYNRASVLCHPAVDDAFGFVVEEAMHHALPVIISANCGAWDVVENGREGFVIPARDPDAVAERLVHMSTHSEERIAMGRQARATALRECVPARYRESLANFYRPLAGSPQ